MEESGDFELVDKSYIASLLIANNIDRREVSIDVMDIKALEDYIKEKKERESKDTDVRNEEERQISDEQLSEDEIEEVIDLKNKQVSNAFVVPITLPDGNQVKLVVNQKGIEIATIVEGPEGEKIELNKDIQKNIARSVTGLETTISPDVIISYLTPNTLEDLQRDLAEDTLVLDSSEKVVDKIHQKDPDADVETTKEFQTEKDEGMEEEINEFPSEVMNIIKEMSKNSPLPTNLNLHKQYMAMQITPETLNTALHDTNFKDKGPYVYAIKEINGNGPLNLNGRIIMVQPGVKIVDERKYDSFVNDYMREYEGQTPETENKLEKDIVVVKDPSKGKVSVYPIELVPTDLEVSKKEMLKIELEKLNESTKAIISSDLSPEEKGQQLEKINQKRLDVFREFGVSIPEIETNIQNDIDISRANDTSTHDDTYADDDHFPSRPEEHGLGNYGNRLFNN